jgi:hypothetical protein
MWRERDSVVLAGKISREIEGLRSKNIAVHTIFADGGGLGGPIIDILKHSGYPMREILFGSTAADSVQCSNKGSEIWSRMRDWLAGGAIPDDPELEQQLVSRDYQWHPKTHQLSLVSKDKMLAEGLPSPDRADAFALTFSEFIVATADAAIHTRLTKCLSDLEDTGPDEERFARTLAFEQIRRR